MSSEFMLDGGDGAAAATAYGEFHLTLTVAGDPAGLRQRLGDAAEKLGYRIVCDDPLIVRRGAVGSGSTTTTVLDYARTLKFRLKPASAGSTQVTFNYIGYPLNYRRARNVITREAEAIAAIASARSAACPSCGLASVDESSFCRRCGAPMLREPAELDLLRVTNEAHAGNRDLAIAAAGIAFGIVTYALILLVKGMDRVTAATIFALIWMVPSLFLVFTGFRHLASAASRPRPDESKLAAAAQPLLTDEPPAAHSLQAPPASVTENTTNLLTTPTREPAAVLIDRGGQTRSFVTGEITPIPDDQS